MTFILLAIILLVTRIDSKDGATSNYGSIDYQGNQLFEIL